MATGVIARSPLRCMILKTQEFNPSPNLCGPGIGFWIDARRPRGATPTYTCCVYEDKVIDYFNGCRDNGGYLSFADDGGVPCR
ncbi:hypothetical protein Ptr902_10119 [Pyrenophora tritici-repentis]|uniref:Uncharacterized protein n=1 Tax=Pyrenophora tritici-repentis TaxID=45151 RepID=A0A5M9KU85_9PLEO|nr:hypothetical protein PtrV1_12439 [Pyrenophora tritici-repentis]KAF7445243.1 hypothetical protein A1F99_102290 [Pyrenophora tritici-repentis]KAF7565507.1 hypothetical protein PtrM4_049410 [Pyrenophora tritici-repentis]KAI0613113.1 hypothetical protein TUN205_02606 [Pyrenophora tritici-repentis]KAI0625185.1 hypothetical protein TUN199_02782 [Pyrenophora tritici-repentis]